MTTNATSKHSIQSVDRSKFEREGWLLMPCLLLPQDLDGVRASFASEVERMSRAWLAEGRITDSLAELPWEQRFERLRQLVPATHSHSWRRCIASEAVFRLWQHPALVGVMNHLIGDELWASSTWNGRPRTSGNQRETIGWHQDAHYMHDYRLGIDRMLSCWIPLVPVDANSGCLAVCPGSARGGLQPMVRFPENGLVGVADAVVADYTPISVAMQPGDVLIFDELTFHRSCENQSGRTRWSLDIRYCDSRNKHRTDIEMGHIAEWSGIRHGVGYRCASRDPQRIGQYADWIAGYQYQGEF